MTNQQLNDKQRHDRFGKRLGASDESLAKSRVLAAEALKNKTDDWHAQVLTWIEFAKQQMGNDSPSLQKIADYLNSIGLRTKRGKHFKTGTIHAIMKREKNNQNRNKTIPWAESAYNICESPQWRNVLSNSHGPRT